MSLAVAVVVVASWVLLRGDLQRTITTTEQQTELWRNLHPARPVAVSALEPADFQHIGTRLESTKAAIAEARRLGRAYHYLGLLPAGTDLGRLEQASQGAQVIGLYSPATKHLYIQLHSRGNLFGLGDTLSLYDQDTLVHEYTHALQDQVFGWHLIFRPTGHGVIYNTDAALAQEAVVEGDAEETRVWRDLHVLSPANIDRLNQQITTIAQAAQADQARLHLPAIIGDVAQFPYEAGRLYVRNQVVPNGGSFAAIDAMYRGSPYPCSTWTILQSAGPQYDDSPDGFDGCAPLPVPPGPAGWSLQESDVLGALRLGEIDGVLAARWGGDRYAFFTRGQQTLLLWHLRIRLYSTAPIVSLATYFDQHFGDGLDNSVPQICQIVAGVGPRHAVALVSPNESDTYVAVATDPTLLALLSKVVRTASGSC